MRIKKAVEKTLRESLIPELAALKQTIAGTKAVALGTTDKAPIDITEKRMDDMIAHLVDQSCHIDRLHEELGGHALIDSTKQSCAWNRNKIWCCD